MGMNIISTVLMEDKGDGRSSRGLTHKHDWSSLRRKTRLEDTRLTHYGEAESSVSRRVCGERSDWCLTLTWMMALTGFRNSCEMTLIMNSCCRLNVDEVEGGRSAWVVDRVSEDKDGLLLVGFLAQLLCFLETRAFVCDGDFLQSLGVRDVGVGHDDGGDVPIDVSQRDLDDQGWKERSAFNDEKFSSRWRGRAI